MDKEWGDTVSAATLNHSGFLRCEATRVGEATTPSPDHSGWSATRRPHKGLLAKVADRVSGVSKMPAVIGIWVGNYPGMAGCGQSIGFALARGNLGTGNQLRPLRVGPGDA